MGRRKHRHRGRNKWSQSSTTARQRSWATPVMLVAPEAIQSLADQHFGGRYYQVGADHD